MLKNNILIIAEAGVNHNGSIDKAIKMINIAKEAGADVIKFQTAVPNLVMTKNAVKASYQIKGSKDTESQLEMVKKIHFPLEVYAQLKKECDDKNIEFMSTPFDEVSINTLKKLHLKKYKIPSGEITNLPYLRKIASLKKPTILSTGMATMDEIIVAHDILIEFGAKSVAILHCNTEYPTPIQDVNLNAMLAIKKKLKVTVGYSDHTLGTEVPIAAAALGASIIEKHFTLDRSLNGPDHAASLEPKELNEMIIAIRNIEKAMGSGLKVPSPSETKNILIARKSIVAKKIIKKGDLFTEQNLTVKRPGTGVSPMKWDSYLGKKSNKNYKIDELIK